MVEFLDRDRRSNSVLPSRFGLDIKPPRRPNFAQNMHTNKQCRRSLARPYRTTPEYHDVDHGVAMGRPRRFCVIEPIAFVGGMGGWCCWTWCAVVFAVVLRSCAGYFLFICEQSAMCVMLRIPAQWQHIGDRRKALDEMRQHIAGDCVGLSKKSMILDYLWQYPAYVNLLNMVHLVSVSYPPVFLIPRSIR